MKLTIKHLAGYLPYGLKIKVGSSLCTMTIDEYSFDKKGINSILEYDLKPILRPLSDLTKEIEVNGKMFVPYDLFTETFGSNDDTLFENMNDEKNELHYSVCKDLPYYAFEWLCSLHFDIYGLIEANLAIDINTLK